MNDGDDVRIMRINTVRFAGISGRFLCAETLGPRFVLLLFGFPPGDIRSKHHAEMQRITRQGWSILVMDYPGVRDSDGEFSPANALAATRKALAFLRKGKATDAWTRQPLAWECDDIAVCGVSFGGAVALTLAAGSDVRRVLAVSPVVDWNEELGESDAQIKRILGSALPHTVRLSKDWSDWSAVQPADHLRALAAKDVFIVSAKDDDVVPAAQGAWLADKTGAHLTLLAEGGHVGAGDVPLRVWKRFLH